ncbi:hypothetical protein [Haloarcula sp. 1CSR25-25]|uniref:hypothetical protein n=1 Tax=Haloarcula sp. 1CSR25-25 TaxID=2862545 RepID=UPI00289530BA|nr:hypothetical protein [Haloarcula sp. 1CSR25-25]MDT3437876.1 hypothetical protein [Haloarcula sp. 1CSR25-25]
MAVDNHTTAASASSTGDGGQSVETLADSASFACEITISGSVTTENTIAVREDGEVFKYHDACEPVWMSHTVDTYECLHCDEQFETEAEAREHLERKYNRWKARYTLPGVPHNSVAESVKDQIQFRELEQFRWDGVEVSVRPSGEKRIGEIEDGTEYLIASSHRSFALPPDYEFSSWEPLDGGKLTYPDGVPRIREYPLKKAIHYLSVGVGANYDSEKYTLYD